jgi:S1-C subfamily serine protease
MKNSLKVALGLTGAAALTLLFFVGTAPKNLVVPRTDTEFAKISVSVEAKDRRAGGSGVILRSTQNESFILTNKHVCDLVKSGGKVVHEGASYEVQEVKPYPKHDLCLVKVFHSFGINVRIAREAPALYSSATIAGHPSLMPTVMTHGHFSGKETIKIIADIRPCTEKDMEENGLFCVFLGGIPVVKSFETQVVSATILPGSSGSPVFNSRGELSGMAFASRSQELSYAYIVPYEYLYDFMRTEGQLEWIKTKDGGKKSRLFKSASLSNDECYRLSLFLKNTTCHAIFNPSRGIR